MKFLNIDIEDEKNNEIKKKIKKMNNDENEGGFVSHLTELRKRLIHSFIFFLFFLLVVIFLQNIFMVF